MPTAGLNGVELYFETAGTGELLVLTHGSWTDGSGWAPVVEILAERYTVVTWDRRGHSRSQPGAGPGSRDQDAADLAALIAHLTDTPVHVAGNSYGAIVSLTLVGTRPELVASAAVHEPPVMALLEGTDDAEIATELGRIDQDLAVVAELIESDRRRDAAEHFIDRVALGPGSWAQLPEPFKAVLEGNAPTYLDELRDPTSSSVDLAALATTSVPLKITLGSESPRIFAAITDALTMLVPDARIETIAGAGHIPYATHPHQWADILAAFHATVPTSGSRR